MAEGCTAGQGIRFVRLSSPTLGLARRGVQLDGEVALYASRCQLRAWPGGGGRGGAYETGCLHPVSGVMLPTMPDLRTKQRGGVESGMKRSGPTPSTFRRVGFPGGSGTYCWSGTPPLLDSCWTYERVGYTFGLRMCADTTTPSYLAVSDRLAGGERGKRDLCCCFYHPARELW